MKVNRELHKAGDRSCMHVEFNLEGSKMRYEAGDHLAVYPVNDNDLVERLGKLCGSDLDTVFSLINTDTDSSKKHPFPCPTTYRAALTHYLEITALPRTHIIKELVEYCSDEKDKELLKLMSSTTPEGKAKYQTWVQDACRNIVHILEDCPSCRPPIDHICELLPRLQPRYYSISSSSKVSLTVFVDSRRKFNEFPSPASSNDSSHHCSSREIPDTNRTSQQRRCHNLPRSKASGRRRTLATSAYLHSQESVQTADKARNANYHDRTGNGFSSIQRFHSGTSLAKGGEQECWRHDPLLRLQKAIGGLYL